MRRAVLRGAREAGLRCEGVVSTAFGCPYEGHVPPERVLEIAAALRDARRPGDRLRGHHRDGQPGAGRGLLQDSARDAARRGGRADRPLPQHPRRRARQRAERAPRRGRELRVELRRARRLPRAAGLDRQPRQRGPRLDAPRDGHPHRRGPGGAAGVLAPRPGDPRAPARQPHAGGRPRRLGRAAPSRRAPPSGCRRGPAGGPPRRPPRRTPGRRSPSPATGRSWGGRRRRSRAWRGRRRCGSWPAVPRPARRWRPRAPPGAPRG